MIYRSQRRGSGKLSLFYCIIVDNPALPGVSCAYR